MVTLISAFEVPPDADETFVAGWELARDFLASRHGYRTPALHRALRADVDFRFVDVASVDSPDAWRAGVSDPGYPGAEMPFPAHPSLYEVVREDGAPDGAGGVILINPFEVPEREDERFLAGWERTRDLLVQQRGYLGTRLHRSLGPAGLRFANIARWSSPLAFAKAAEQSEVRQAASAIPFRGHPALYQVIRD